jgi:hypothetical protein
MELPRDLIRSPTAVAACCKWPPVPARATPMRANVVATGMVMRALVCYSHDALTTSLVRDHQHASNQKTAAVSLGERRGVMDIPNGTTITDFMNSYHQAGDIGTGAAEQLTESRERMNRMRADLVADMRNTTPADPKGNRKMVLGALSVLAPDSPLRRRLSRCGKRDAVNDSRWFCRRPCCGVCMARQAKWLVKTHLWPALQEVLPAREPAGH